MLGPIHLFEPGKTGHRPVIARYTVKCLQQFDIPCFLDETPLDPGLNSLTQLDSRAKENDCRLTHVLTVEDHLRRFLKDGFGHRKIVPSVGNYYLYTNLKTILKGAGIWLAMKRAKIERLLVSDEIRQDYRWGLGDRADFVADPWDPDEFPVLTREQARQRLGLPEHTVVFLLFGNLSPRKGALFVVDAFERMASGKNVMLLLAGKPDPEVAHALGQLDMQSPKVRADLEFIPEEQVSAYFFASDFVVSAYPAWFRVSSGGFTRACAAGRPSIVGNTGSLGRRVAHHRCGMTYQTGNVAALADAFMGAFDCVVRPEYNAYCLAASRLGKQCQLPYYGQQLIASYRHAGWSKAKNELQRMPLDN